MKQIVIYDKDYIIKEIYDANQFQSEDGIIYHIRNTLPDGCWFAYTRKRYGCGEKFIEEPKPENETVYFFDCKAVEFRDQLDMLLFGDRDLSDWTDEQLEDVDTFINDALETLRMDSVFPEMCPEEDRDRVITIRESALIDNLEGVFEHEVQKYYKYREEE